MDERKLQLAGQALRNAVMMMQKTAPGMLQVYMGVTGIPTDDPNVAVRAGVNGGSPILEYNVDFVSALEPTLLGAIIYMECERIALHHCDRRKQEPLDMLKLASDVVVAEYARKLVDTSVGKNLEIVNRLFPSFWNYWPILQKHDFHPETDLTLEKLFKIFKEEYATMKPEEEDEDEQDKKKERNEGKSKDEHETQSKGTKNDAKKKEGSKDGTENAETSGSPGESDEQGDGKDNGSSGEDGKDKGEEESGENGDGGQGESGEGEQESGSDSDNESSGESGDKDSTDQGNDGQNQDSTPEENQDDDGGSPGGGGGDGSSGEGADGGSEPGGNPGDGESGDDGEGDDGDGEGEGGTEGDSGRQSDEIDGGSGQGDPSKKDDFENMSRYFSLTNAGNDLERWGQDDVARDNVTSTVNEALDKGMFDRVRGPLPIMLRNANRVKVDKEAMFRKFMTSLQDDERDETWSRRNRKFLRYGMIAPGYVYKETQRILFCVDVSGSMYQGDAIANCLTVMENVVNGLSIDLVYWDAVCSPVFNTPKSIKDMAIYGGGYTDPDCVLRKLGPERFKYDGLIFLTDCIFNWRRPPRHKQIMILRTHGEHEFPEWCVYKDDLEKFIGH